MSLQSLQTLSAAYWCPLNCTLAVYCFHYSFFHRSRGLDISFNFDEDKENIESIDMVKHIQIKIEEMDVSSFDCII